MFLDQFYELQENTEQNRIADFLRIADLFWGKNGLQTKVRSFNFLNPNKSDREVFISFQISKCTYTLPYLGV